MTAPERGRFFSISQCIDLCIVCTFGSDYKAAIDAVVTEAISKAADQKKRKTS